MDSVSFSSNISKFEEENISQDSDFDDYVQVTCTRALSFSCEKNYQAREAGTTENLEQNSEMNVTVNPTFNERSSNHDNNRGQDDSTCVNLTADPEVGAARIGQEQFIERYSSRSPYRRSTKLDRKVKKRRSLCQRVLTSIPWTGVSTFLSILALLAGVYNYLNRETVEPVTSVPNPNPEFSSLQDHTSHKISGRFTLNIDGFLSSNKTVILWESVGSSESSIIASKNESCLIVPESGKYGVFSTITFSLDKDNMEPKLSQYLRLYGYQEGEQKFQRRVQGVPIPENRNDPELIPSSFNSFVEMKAGGKICVFTSLDLTKYVFPSRIDNSINVWKW